jgi:N-acetylmuramoyl-L-alanine amidase
VSAYFTKRIQQELAKRGFDPKGIDGKLGPGTFSAFMQALGNDPIVDNIAGKEALKKTPVSEIEVRQPSGVTAENGNKITIPGTKRRIDEIIVHCAATREGKDYTVAQIRNWHKARGWSDIGYHFVVYRNGEIHPGRPINKIGAHVGGRNTGTVGICYVGGVDSGNVRAKDTRTLAQEASLLWLVTELSKKFSVKKISGHNQYAAKACPSFDVRKDDLGNIPGFRRGNKQ